MEEKSKNFKEIINFGLISIELIKMEHNIRTEYKEQDIDKLSESMKKIGQLQPICVYKKGDNYFIIFGHRRFLAAKKAKFNNIFVIVVEEPEEIDIFYMQIIENEESKSFTPEERESYINLLREKGESFKKIAQTLNMSESWVRECYIAYNVRVKHRNLFENTTIVFGTNDLYKLRNSNKEQIDEAISLSVEHPEEKKEILSDLNKRTKKKRNVGGKKNKNLEFSLLDYNEIFFGIRVDKEKKEYFIKMKVMEGLNEEEKISLLKFIHDIYIKRGYNKINT